MASGWGSEFCRAGMETGSSFICFGFDFASRAFEPCSTEARSLWAIGAGYADICHLCQFNCDCKILDDKRLYPGLDWYVVATYFDSGINRYFMVAPQQLARCKINE